MPKFFYKQSSSNKTVSLSRNSSLRSTSNDTSTNPILDAKLKAKFQSFQSMIKSFKEHGDSLVSMKEHPDLLKKYPALLKEYQDLHKNIKKSKLSDTDKNLLLFETDTDRIEIYKHQDDIAWQERDFSTHTQSFYKRCAILSYHPFL